MIRRLLSLALFALVLPMLLTACDDEEPKVPPQGGAQDAGENSDPELPTLVIPAPHPHATRLLGEMFETNAPTSELMADWPGGRDAETVELVDRLRRTVLWLHNRGWMPEPEDGWWWADDRACPPEALISNRVLRVGVTVLALTEATAKELGVAGDLVRLAKPVDEVLGAAAQEGCVRATYGRIALRAGETGRLTAGWTRARRFATQDGDQVENWGGSDVFSGLRIAVTARGAEGQEPWDLSVFASLSRLEGDTGVEVSTMERLGSTIGGEKGEKTKTLTQAHRTQTTQRLPESNTVQVTGEQKCWITSMRADSQDEPIQVLICAELVDLE